MGQLNKSESRNGETVCTATQSRYLATIGKTVMVGQQAITEHACPHCGWEWLEYSDMPEYPYYCPGCGESLWRDE